MTMSTNRLSVPEITAYSCTVRAGMMIICYLVRAPGQAAWQPVRLVRPARPEDTVR